MQSQKGEMFSQRPTAAPRGIATNHIPTVTEQIPESETDLLINGKNINAVDGRLYHTGNDCA